MLKNKNTLLISSIFIAFFINLFFIVSIHFSWNKAIEKYLPLISETNSLKNQLFDSHLWLEEAIAGDTSINIEKDVFIPLEHKSFYIYTLSIKSAFVSSEDKAYLEQLEQIETKLHNFLTMAKTRWSDSKQSYVGSVLDQKFDSEFENIIDKIDRLTALINKNIQADVVNKNTLFKWLIVFYLLINFSIIIILFISKRKQKHYENSLFEEKEKAIVTLKSIGDAVVITDLNGHITFLNNIAEKITEKTTAEVKGVHVDDVLNLWNIKSGKKIQTPIDDVLYNNLTKLISNGTKLISKSGKEYIISDSAASIKDSNGKIFGTVLVFQDDTKKHLIKDELQKNQEINEVLKERMELALLGSKDGIWDWNIVTNEVYLSSQWKQMIGYSDNELKNEFSTWDSRVHPDDLTPTMIGLQENIDGKTEYYEGIHRLKHKSGHWVWILDRGKAFFDEDGKATRMIGTHTDVSKDKELEFRSAQRGKILDNSANEIYIFDAHDFKYLYINKGAQKNMGYSQEEMLEMTPIDIKPTLALHNFIELLKPITEEGKENIHFSIVHQRKDNSKYNADIYLQPTKFEGHDAYVAYILDVTKRKEAEDKLAHQHTLLQNIVDTVPVRIFWKNVNLDYLGANKLFLNDAKVESLDDIVGKNDFSLPWGKTEAEIYRADDMKVMSSGISNINFEESQTNEDGSITTLLTSKVPLRNAEGKIIGVLGSYADISRQRQTEEELKKQKNILDHQAHHDALTGLPNRVLFNDRVSQAIEKSKRYNLKFALLFIDLDHFKEVNDSLGHDVGDEILKTVTSRLKKVIRGEDTISRFGGDEFTVILEDLTQIQDASFIADKLLHSLSQSMNVNDNVLYVSSSIGISIYPDDGVSTQNLLKFADSAMYKAKNEGRNNYQYYNAMMTELAFERVIMETSLREALKKEEFVVYYQTQVDGTNNKLIGMEALVRWQHPTQGIISPAKFIPLAESTGLIIELDRYVMRTAMSQVVQWYKEGLNPGVLAMNLAIKQLNKKDFLSTLKNMMKETGCKSKWVELEVTEGQVMTNPEEAIKVLQQISDLGIKLAIDDFGTGYSSLAYLKRLPIDKLKIDQEFVRNLPNDEEDVGITKAVIALAKSLNLNVIAEGVETKEQRDFLVENGCENIQGYYYSKPISADAILELLKRKEIIQV